MFNSTFDTKWGVQANLHLSISSNRSNFCNQFFNFAMHIDVHQPITKSWKDFQLFINDLIFLPINILNLKISQKCSWSIRNLWFHITGNYLSGKTNHNNRIDFPKYLNKNKALFKHKNHMMVELYLLYCILGIQATWRNWNQIPQTSLDTQKLLLSLQLHI